MDHVYLTVVTDCDGDHVFDAHRAVHSTHEKAATALAQWCRDAWVEQHGLDEDHPPNPDAEYDCLPADDDAAIAAYFEFWTPEMKFTIDQMKVDEES